MARAEAERDVARLDASMARMDAVAAGSGRARRRWSPSWLGSNMPWRLQRRLGGRWKTRLAVWPTNEYLCFYNLGLVRMKCPLFG